MKRRANALLFCFIIALDCHWSVHADAASMCYKGRSTIRHCLPVGRLRKGIRGVGQDAIESKGGSVSQPRRICVCLVHSHTEGRYHSQPSNTEVASCVTTVRSCFQVERYHAEEAIRLFEASTVAAWDRLGPSTTVQRAKMPRPPSYETGTDDDEIKEYDIAYREWLP